MCQPGDLVILDECHRFFSSDRTLSSDARIFAAEHRHYSDPETGFTCDLILVNQALSTLPRFLKERVEQTFRMKKLGALAGFGNKYRVDVFDGVKLTKSTRITFYIESYKKEIFPLYKSHDAPGAVEVKADNRGTLFKSSSLLIYIFMLMLAVFLIWRYAYPYFNPKDRTSARDNKTDLTQVDNKSALSNQSRQPEARQPARPPVSDWCIIGQIKRKTGRYIFLKDTFGRVRMVSGHEFTGYGAMLEGIVDGNRVVVWSCTPVVSGVSKGIL